MTRRVLPQRRRALTFDLVFENQIITISAGYFSNGDLGEIFIGAGKAGTDLSTLARDIAITLSLALQHGVAIGVIQHAVLRDARGKPLSLIGAVVDELARVLP
jgi:hypothetical protein